MTINEILEYAKKHASVTAHQNNCRGQIQKGQITAQSGTVYCRSCGTPILDLHQDEGFQKLQAKQE